MLRVLGAGLAALGGGFRVYGGGNLRFEDPLKGKGVPELQPRPEAPVQEPNWTCTPSTEISKLR